MGPLIQIDSLEYSYPLCEQVLKGVNLVLNQGERIGLLGTNGSGKSTLLRIIMGLSKPHGGQLKIFGKERKEEEDFQPQVLLFSSRLQVET